jgi:hypothetical protein
VWYEQVLTAQDVKDLRSQATQCVQVLKLLRSSLLVLDEVDLLLHPLKSELHWTLGQKHLLDFTKSSIGDGIRWLVPFHLLDAIFSVSHGRTLEDWQGSQVRQHIK